MSENKESGFVNLDQARFDDQREVMKRIIDSGECPFCPENLEIIHSKPIDLRLGNWVLTHNAWPYAHTETHLLAIPTYHVEQLSDLKKGSFEELLEMIIWAEKEYDITSGGIAMRFGDIKFNGSSVKHLHAHIIVPDRNKSPENKVKFKISE